MASVPLYSNKLSEQRVLPVTRSITLNRRGFACDTKAIQKISKSFSSVSDNKRWRILNHATSQNKNTRQEADPFLAVGKRISIRLRTITDTSVVCALSNEESQETSELSSAQKQVRALDSYLNKLQRERREQSTPSMSSIDTETATLSQKNMKSSEFPSRDLLEKSGQLEAKKELNSLEDYMGKVNAGLNSAKNFSNFDDEPAKPSPIRSTSSVSENYGEREENKANDYVQTGQAPSLENNPALWPQDEAPDLYLVGVLASINIAVFLFEVASPVRNSDIELFTLPSLYGAKINQLILDGEWWRLVTPMFLHSGILHVALGCWVLLTFGPQVCKRYGSCTFFLIYLLGGISGNFTSFIHTPEPTVGGTGPIFAIIGAWLIYQVQNKEVISQEVSESMFRKAVIAIALSSLLSNFGPIDDWTHLGAACSGIAFGFLTCPILQLDDTSSKNSREDRLALVKRNVDPLKSIIMFIISIIILSSLFFFLGPQVSTLDNGFV